MRILFVGDVVGRPGLEIVERRLRGLREELGADLCVTNGENAADGVGLTPRLAERILAAGSDVLTLGNHTWRRIEITTMLETSDRVIRPANMPRALPGKGLAVATAADGTRVAVINLLGSLFLQPAVSPWELVDDLVEQAREQAPVVLVDMHAEATSEKVAMALHLDGRVSAVLGTHTHVQTADERVLPGGTATITDVGMTGPHGGVIGVKAELAIRRMRTGYPVRFEVAEEDVRLQGALLSVDPVTGRSSAIERIDVA
ncbi:MAG: TIGR00282 family metallophosphoesterase [Gaiella sp.]